MSAHWRRLNKEMVFKTSIFELHKETSESARTGAVHDFYYINCIDWVNVIAVTPKNEIILIKQYRHGSGRMEREIPGGGLDPKDPNPISGGARELLEETGYEGKNGQIIGQVCPNPAIQGNICYTVMFTDCEQISEPQMEQTETIETVLVPVESITDLILEGKISHGLVLNALHFYELIRNKE
jgi:8-oxo-dGTP pyrophosphatase MutT (NUDIX family)